VSLYESVGFTKNFMWYAPRTTTTVSPTDTRTWTACTVGVPTGGICPSLKVGPMSRDFDGTFELSIIGNDTTFIALVCGNYTSADPANFTPPPYTNPVPRIDGTKYRDDNRNGIREAGEPALSGWNITITRLSSRIGQTTGTVANLTTDSTGYYRFDLDGHGPGRYLVEEIPQAGWKNYTPLSYTIDVDFGVESRRYGQDFGNAPTTADVAKTAMTIVSNLPPTWTRTRLSTSTCPSPSRTPVRPNRSQSVTNSRLSCRGLRRHQRRPSLVHRHTASRPTRHPHLHLHHRMLSTIEPRLRLRRPVDDHTPRHLRHCPGEQHRHRRFERPVHADTDLGVDATLDCDPATNVGDTFNCTSDVTVTNTGFDDVDATATTTLIVPDDCNLTSQPGPINLTGLDKQDSVTTTVTFDVDCAHRSFHPIALTANVTPDDIHVFDTNPTNNTSSPANVTTEVFHDATLAADAVHLTCNETIGTGDPFTCTTTVDVSKTGPRRTLTSSRTPPSVSRPNARRSRDATKRPSSCCHRRTSLCSPGP